MEVWRGRVSINTKSSNSWPWKAAGVPILNWSRTSGALSTTLSIKVGPLFEPLSLFQLTCPVIDPQVSYVRPKPSVIHRRVVGGFCYVLGSKAIHSCMEGSRTLLFDVWVTEWEGGVRERGEGVKEKQRSESFSFILLRVFFIYS